MQWRSVRRWGDLILIVLVSVAIGRLTTRETDWICLSWGACLVMRMAFDLMDE